MKVSLQRSEDKEGLIFKKPIYLLHVTVELSPEERTALESANVGDYIVVEYEHKGSELNYHVKDVLYYSAKGTSRRFVSYDAVERSNLEQELKEGLAGVKRMIEDAESQAAEESFEL